VDTLLPTVFSTTATATASNLLLSLVLNSVLLMDHSDMSDCKCYFNMISYHTRWWWQCRCSYDNFWL